MLKNVKENVECHNYSFLSFVYFSVSVPGDFESKNTLTLLYNTVGVG